MNTSMYCFCDAAQIQIEIDCLKKSLQDALDQDVEESSELKKRSQEQQREIDQLKAQIKESNEREDKLECQLKDMKRGLKEIKRRISKSNSGSSLTSFTSSASSSSMKRISSIANLLSLNGKLAHVSESNPSLARTYHSELNLPSLVKQDETTTVETLKLRLEAREKEIISLRGIVSGNLKMMKLLEQKSLEKKYDSS